MSESSEQVVSEVALPERIVGMRVALCVSALSILFPWSVRRWLLQTFCKYSIAKSARIGYSLLSCPTLHLAAGARIGHFNVIKGACLVMGECASIGDFNWIAGLPRESSKHFLTETARRPALQMDRHASLTSRHFIDCSNLVHVGEFSTIAGARSQILTHAIDLRSNRQVSAPVRIGRFCFVGTGSIILKNARLPDCSVLAAHSSLARSFDQPFTLYSGVPAGPVKPLDPGAAYFHRQSGFVD